MIVLLEHDADTTTVTAVLERVEALGLRAVMLDGRRGRALEIVGPDRGRALALAGTPGVRGILTRRTPLEGGEPVWPHFALRVSILLLLILVLLAGLTAFAPPGLGDEADRAATQTTDAQALASVEWYLRPAAALSSALGPEHRALGGTISLLAWLLLLGWPFLFRRRRASSRGTRAVLALIALLGLAGPLGAQQDDMPSCTMSCHGEPRTAFAKGVHADVLTCTDCHGGDPTALRDKAASHSVAAGFVGKPTRQDIPALCGECHADPLRMFAYGLRTDQLATYRTSQHGKALFGQGDTSVAVCTDCHGSHAILPASNPAAPTNRINQPKTCGTCHEDAEKMAQHDLPVGVVAEFSQSVHGRSLLVDRARGAPTCTDCHGAHGTAPPGVESLVHVCSSCHVNTAEAYARSPHAATPDMRCGACHEGADEIPGARRSGCAACHGTHGIAKPGPWMLHGEEVGHCGHCHRDPDGSTAVIAALEGGTGRLQQTMDETLAEIRDAKQRGLFLDNEQSYLRESMRTLVSVQPLSHSMDTAAISARLEDGIKRQDRTREQVLRKGNLLRDRKILLGGGALLLLMLVGLLAFKLDALRKLS